MRTLTLALLTTLALGAVTSAQAADLDYGVLRGPDYEPEAPLIDWNGVYVGGHGGYTSALSSMRNAYTPALSELIGQTTYSSNSTFLPLSNPPSRRTEGRSFGAFAGINYQFDETVVGIEADYTRFDQAVAISGEASRLKTNTIGFYENVHLTGAAVTRIEEYGTIRARGGYVIGNFLPFATAGLAVGRINVRSESNYANYQYNLSNGANSGYNAFDPNSPNAATPKITTTRTDRNRLMVGLALGAGLEFAVTQNIILRGEYQYVLFDDSKAMPGGRAQINTVRGGAAVKF